MFSPSLSQGGPATATRSRRRQRPVSLDNSLVQQPKAKRQRLPLTEQTFSHPASQSNALPNALPEMLEVKGDQIAKLPATPDGIENTPATATATATATAAPKSHRRDVVVRSKKPKQGERTGKSDGSVELTKTAVYVVSKLQALPDRIRADSASRQHGAVHYTSGYALCLTHTHALIWPYALATPSPETFTFTLPYPSKHDSDPLPLGSLVPPSSKDEEPGLVVVMPVTGKITFWEYISSAATLDFIRQQRNGVEDTIPGMFSGERVVQITSADTTGFILSMSSGRLAYLGVRDGQGKPVITVHFLSDSTGHNSGGWPNVFGSIRNALKQSVYRGDIAAVRADRTNTHGVVNVVAATRSGRLQSWRVQRGGHHEALANVDAHEAILAGLQQVLPPVASHVDLEIVDLTFVPRGIEAKYTDVSRLSEALTLDDDSVQHLLLLVCLSDRRQSQYALVEVVLRGDAFDVGMLRTISTYSSPVNHSATERPRLYLPRPGLVAFLVFDHAVVVASIASPPESPESQLQEDNNLIPATYEDVIDLRSDAALEIVGSGMEEPLGPGQEPESTRSHRQKAKNPTALLMVRSVGIVRVATVDIDRFTTEKPPEVTAKSKLEQAVFFGLKEDNPLVFEGQRGLPFSNEEIGEAALTLSHGILTSSATTLPPLPTPIDANIRQRINYLDRLMSHLNTQGFQLTRAVRWGLLFNAEKLNMAREVWKLHEAFLAERADHEKKTIVSHIVEFINENDKNNPNRAVGEVDRVRHWFIHDIYRMDIFMPWTYQLIKYYHRKDMSDNGLVTRFLYEGTQLTCETLKGTFDYRQRSLDFYGLGDEVLSFGILARGTEYAKIPEFWTSTFFITNNLYRLIELCHLWLETHYPPTVGPGHPDPGQIETIRSTLPSLTDEYVRVLREHVNWASANKDEDEDEDSNSRQNLASFIEALDGISVPILRLSAYGLWNEAIGLAEKHNQPEALAELLVTQIVTLRQQVIDRATSLTRAAEVDAEANDKEAHLVDAIDAHDEKFAFRAYQLLLEQGGIQMILDFAAVDRKGYATKFLRDNVDKFGKIAWLNEVEREQDLETAADTLREVAKSEDQVWSKKIELSLGKLALLAEDSNDDTSGPMDDKTKSLKRHDNLSEVQRDLDLIAIQDEIYKTVLPAILNAVDEEAEVELASQAFELPKLPKKCKALRDDYQRAMGKLIRHQTMSPWDLVDLLSLIKVDEHTDPSLEPLFLALRVADLGLQGEERLQAQRLIWRRCYIRDDWTKINHTEHMDDVAVLEILGETLLYATMFACVAYHLEQGHEDFSYVKNPRHCEGVLTEPDEWRFRTEMDSSQIEKHIEAMKWEDSTLKKYVKNHRLDKWADETLENARRVATAQLDLVTAAAATANGQANGYNKGDGPAMANGVH